MNMQIVNSFALIGGSGCTLMLLLDTLLFSKNKASETVSKMAILPGLFNINEPVIYGYPIVYNLPLMIPFVLLPDLFIGITYGLTCAGIISPCIAQVPWTMPPSSMPCSLRALTGAPACGRLSRLSLAWPSTCPL